MELKAILNIIQSTAKNSGLSEPFLCGGAPRDKALGKPENIDDVDVTNGDATIHKLAEEVGRILEPQNGHYKVLADGHAQIHIDGIKIDFSSNYMAPNIESMLKAVGVKNPDPMLMELMSRDFTCNALLMTMDLKTITDPTGLGLNDIKKKKLRTCLPAKFTLDEDNKRVVRVLYLAAKLGFNVDPEIIDWVKQNPGSISNVKPKYLANKLQKALDIDKGKTIGLITEMGLWRHIPIMPSLHEYLSKNPGLM